MNTQAREIAHSSVTARPAARARALTGRAVTAIAALFLTFDATVKLLSLSPALEANARLGYPASVVVQLGALEVALLAVYLIPRTAVIGAILWTGYLGGAIATHVRAGSRAFETIFPLFVAALLWGGLWLRDGRVRALVTRQR